MPVGRRGHKQTITYWSPATVNNAGDPTWGAPATQLGFWSDHEQIVALETGEERRSKALVALTSDVIPKGYLFRGTSTATDPTVVQGAYHILQFRKTPSFISGEYERLAVVG